MPNWTKSMEQSFEYYIVDPGTWKDDTELKNVKPGSSINRDSDTDTLGSASIDIIESVGECYVRIYLVTIQNGVRERFPLGTFLIQTPSTSFDGKVRSVTVDAYTPLIELKENPPPLGYSLLEGENIMENAYRLVRENARAPVVKPVNDKTLENDFVSNTQDTWVTFISDLIQYAKYDLGLDEMGRIIFLPKQDAASLQPVWTYTDDNSSILMPDLTLKHDLYDVPNAVEVIYSTPNEVYYSKVVNDDSSSPISTVNRGREKLRRVTDAKLGNATQAMVDEYARQLLESFSTLEYTVKYSHGYCPVRIGDCVRLNYKAAGLENITAKVISQTIKCEPGCPVSETAVFTKKLWG